MRVDSGGGADGRDLSNASINPSGCNMSTASKLSKWLVRLLMLICIFAICGVSVVALSRLGILTHGQSLTLGAILFFASVILQRQFEISRNLNRIKAQFMALDEYEHDIRRRLEELTQRLNAVQQTPQPVEVASKPADRNKLSAAAGNIEPPPQDNLDLTSIHQPDLSNDDDDTHPVPPVPKKQKESQHPKLPTKLPSKLPSKLDEQSLNMHLQPIVELPSRRPLFFDAFMRLNTTEGQFIEQNGFIKLAETAGLLAKIDKKVIFSAVRMVRKLNHLKKQAGVLCLLSPTTLLSEENFSEISRFLKANSSIAGSIIIEIRQRDWVGLNQDQRDKLQDLSDIGVPLSLGPALDLALDTQALARFGFKYIRVPVSILLHASIDQAGNSIQPSSLASVLQADGIKLIATDVERDREAIGLIDIDVHLAQGLLFAPPRPVKAELLMNTSQPQSAGLIKSDA